MNRNKTGEDRSSGSEEDAEIQTRTDEARKALRDAPVRTRYTLEPGPRVYTRNELLTLVEKHFSAFVLALSETHGELRIYEGLLEDVTDQMDGFLQDLAQLWGLRLTPHIKAPEHGCESPENH